MANNQNLKPFTGADDPRRSNGRPKGVKNISTIIRELENESFDWNLLLKSSKRLQKSAKALQDIGSPLRAIVYRAVADAIIGKGSQQAAAREFLRRAGYGNSIENPVVERLRVEPVIIPDIKPRFNQQT